DPGGLGVAAGGAVRGDGLDAHVGVTDLGRVAGSGGAPSLMEHLSAAPDEADAAQDRVRREMDSAVAQLERGPTDRAMPDALHGAGEEVAASDGLEQLVPGWARSGDVHDLIAERQLVILIMDVATGGEAGVLPGAQAGVDEGGVRVGVRAAAQDLQRPQMLIHRLHRLQAGGVAARVRQDGEPTGAGDGRGRALDVELVDTEGPLRWIGEGAVG